MPRSNLALPGVCTFATLAVALLAMAAPAQAATEAEKAACTPDVWRLCASEVPNVGKIVACLNRNHGKLSSACRMVMEGGPRNKTAGR